MPKQNKCYYILTGAPGSGKSSILSELAKQDFTVIAEPAREILAEQRAIDGDGVSDKNCLLFKELMLSRAMLRYQQNEEATRAVIFDRGIPDILAYSDCFNLPVGAELKAAREFRYNTTVLFLPAWREIFVNDEERTLSFEVAESFGEKLKNVYLDLGYQLQQLPCESVRNRIINILKTIS